MSAKKPNRLASQKSPYLLQHACNPVDWYPWGEEAFARASAENKPVFLSIGYSTCHWCHVMERESFEDEEVASLLNDSFVAVKVDREERPDVDQIYMRVCQAMTGHGGWPLTIIMTPDKKPFFAGTYFPRESRWGRPGLVDILKQAKEAWEKRREKLLAIGEGIVRAVQPDGEGPPGEPKEEVIKEAFERLFAEFDPLFGGFGEAPKFPQPHNIFFLLRFYRRQGEKKALEMAEKTLVCMYKGGIYDHIGFGFSRYATDREWVVPHFEKMLSDNALLACAYLEAYQVTGNPFYAAVARDVFTYVLREMKSPEGGFYSAQDADSEGVEGKFYLWTPEEVAKILGDEEGSFFCRLYDVTPAGNFNGKSVPNLVKSGLEDPPALEEALQKSRPAVEKLFGAREKRVPPAKDDKILTSWNGLLIAALAKGGRILKTPAYTEAAVRAANFLFRELRDENGRLLARYRDKEAALKAYLDDYAFLVWGFLELYETTFFPEFLKKAVFLTGEMIALFGDERGGFFFTGHDAEGLIARPVEVFDGATPSGNSVAALNLLRLAHFTGNNAYRELAFRQMRRFAEEVERFPQGHTFFLTAWQFAFWPPQEIIVAGKRGDPATEAFLEVLQREFLPASVVIFLPAGEENRELREIAPFLQDYGCPDGRAAVYICENYSCREPLTDPRELRRLIAGAAGAFLPV
jgi:uncharacterized protein YyaL (SSP411 family)